MPHHLTQTVVDLPSNMNIFSDKNSLIRDHFKWSSIKKFVYLAFAFSSCSTNFDLFSRVMENVRILDFILIEITIGMTYMCMDFFIKQYTRNIDFNESLNPFLKGITYGTLLQSALWTLLHARDLADSINFLFSLRAPWTTCEVHDCVSAAEVVKKCRHNYLTKMNTTSAHIHYIKTFSYEDGSVLTTRFFVIAIVWVCNFLLSTVADDAVIKIIKITFYWRVISCSLIVTLIILSSNTYASDAIAQMMDMNAPSSFSSSVSQVSYAFGIGFVGIYDFGTMSPFTMVDNAVMIFTLMFTAIALAKSLIVKNLYLVLSKCVEVEISITPQYLLFAILPLSAEFLSMHKLYIIYIYAHITVATVAYLAMATMSMSRLLHNEFRSVKNVYIAGILCVLGFFFSLPLAVEDIFKTIAKTTSKSVAWFKRRRRTDAESDFILYYSSFSSSRVLGLLYGLNVAVLYLGGFKVAIVMWVYGVHKFSTDINFWLGFKPTKFWKLCWMALPIALLGFALEHSYKLTKMIDMRQYIAAVCWICLSLCIATLFIIKTIARYLMSSNLVAAFKNSKSYGPPDPEDRFSRRVFNEILRLRQCTHNCQVLDDTYECQHLPIDHGLSDSESSSSQSLIDLYKDDDPTSSKAIRRISYTLEPQAI